MLSLSLDSLEPAFNLALEEHLAATLPPGHPGLFLLWRNGPSVILGRHQCAAEEVDEGFLAREGIPLVRRMSGGGAVYHDAGNLNFSFISRRSADRGGRAFAECLAPVARALEDVGVRAVMSGRNDLEVAGRKVSGSGQWVRGGTLLHHGTLLVNADMGRLAGALRADPEKIRSKGVRSVRARVANLADLWRPGTTMDALQAALRARCASGRATLAAADLAAAEALAQAKYRRRSWNYGAAPPFTEERRRRFPWGSVCLRLDVRRGRLQACHISGDFFATRDIGELERALTGLEMPSPAFAAALAAQPWGEFFSGCVPAEMARFFACGGDLRA